ncbi:hypothetical protein ACQPXB_19740 [Amycolatopsis sp. CA-161197]|uniref:hypothetical protein n=1 Tax=Amycolatopsis sp. CA-161197 TaxID=3239922 RepID=UPI003D94650B
MVDWARLSHAYGPATDVPAMLAGMVSADELDRGVALDQFEGAVFHQQSLYDSTVASLPFLLDAVATPGLPGRGEILELLAAIGRGAAAGSSRHSSEAARTLAAAAPRLRGLLTDADARVRAAVAEVLALDAGSAPALVQRLAADPDAEVRAALARALGGAVRAGHVSEPDAESIGEALSAAGADPSPLVGIAALAAAGGLPGPLPAGFVARLTEVLDAAYGEGEPPPPPPEAVPGTLRGMLAERRNAELALRPSPHLADLTSETSWVMGDHVGERVAFLAAQLRAPRWVQRGDALRSVHALARGWRGDYRELAALTGEQLRDRRLIEAAANTLWYLRELAAPAADDLVACLAEMAREVTGYVPGGEPAWLRLWPGARDSEPSQVITALALIGDVRVLPALGWLLDHEDMPPYLGSSLEVFGPAAAELLPSIRRRLRDLPVLEHDVRRDRLLDAVGAMGAAAAPAVPELLGLEASYPVVKALGRIGPAAAEAGPMLRTLAERGDRAAALALWQIEGDADLALRLSGPQLEPGAPDAAAGASTCKTLGPAAIAYAPQLRRLLDHEADWTRHHAAYAWWRVTGDPEPVLPVFAALWEASVAQRPAIAACLGEIGFAGEAEPLLRNELASTRRSGVTRIAEPFDIVDALIISADETLLGDCRAALGNRAP